MGHYRVTETHRRGLGGVREEFSEDTVELEICTVDRYWSLFWKFSLLGFCDTSFPTFFFLDVRPLHPNLLFSCLTFQICFGVFKGSDFGHLYFLDYFSHFFEFSLPSVYADDSQSSPVFKPALLQTHVYPTVLEISSCMHIKYFSAASNKNPTNKWEINYRCIPNLDGSWHWLSGSNLSFQQFMWPFPHSYKRATTTSYSRQEGGRGGTSQTLWPRLCYMATANTRGLEEASI